MRLEIVNHNTFKQEKWDELVLAPTSNGEFINSRKYLSYHAQGKFIDHSCAVIDSDSKSIRTLFSAASLPEEKDILISHPGTTFCGIIFDIKQVFLEELGKHLDLLIDYYREKGFKKLEIRIPPVIYYNQPKEDLNFLLWQKGFKVSGYHLAGVIDLRNIKNEDELFVNYMQKRRNQIRKSLKAGDFIFERKEEISEEVWKSLTDNLTQRFSSKPTHTFDEINLLHSRFPEKITPYLISGKNSKKYAAFALIYKFKKVFHTQYLDLNYELSDKYPNLILIHRLILEAKKENFNYLSLGPVTEKWGEVLNSGLFNYKNQFGTGFVIFPKMEKLLK